MTALPEHFAESFVAAEHVALRRLFDAVLDVPCWLDVFESSHPGAALEMIRWANEHGFLVSKTTREGGFSYKCEPGAGRHVVVFA